MEPSKAPRADKRYSAKPRWGDEGEAHRLDATHTWTWPDVNEIVTDKRKQYNQATLSCSEEMQLMTALSTEKPHTKSGPTITPTG
jgi:hypothetical protein